MAAKENPKKKTDKKLSDKPKDPKFKAPEKKSSPKKPYVTTSKTISGDTLQKFISAKDSLSPSGKEALLKLLKLIQDGSLKVGDSEIPLDEEDGVTERNPIAKIEKTQGDLDTYVSQKQRIQFTSKELQAIIGFKDRAQPVQQDQFMVRFETTDGGGSNLTTIIQKEREGQLFNFVAYGKKENPNNKGLPGKEGDEKPEEKDDKGDNEAEMANLSGLKENEDPSQGQEITADDNIVITKSITFTDDTQSADILADLLRKLEI